MDLVSDSSTNLKSKSSMDHVSESLLNDSTIIPPKGWTKNKDLMEYNTLWIHRDSYLQERIRAYKLGTPKPIMCCDGDSGDCATLFQAGNKYYFWIPDANEILEIITSMNLKDIITQIATQGLQSLETVKVPDWYWGKIGGKKGGRKRGKKPGVKAGKKPGVKTGEKPGRKSNGKRGKKLSKKI